MAVDIQIPSSLLSMSSGQHQQGSIVHQNSYSPFSFLWAKRLCNIHDQRYLFFVQFFSSLDQADKGLAGYWLQETTVVSACLWLCLWKSGGGGEGQLTKHFWEWERCLLASAIVYEPWLQREVWSKKHRIKRSNKDHRASMETPFPNSLNPEIPEAATVLYPVLLSMQKYFLSQAQSAKKQTEAYHIDSHFNTGKGPVF